MADERGMVRARLSVKTPTDVVERDLFDTLAKRTGTAQFPKTSITLRGIDGRERVIVP